MSPDAWKWVDKYCGECPPFELEDIEEIEGKPKPKLYRKVLVYERVKLVAIICGEPGSRWGSEMDGEEGPRQSAQTDVGGGPEDS